jgi:GntR family transcriptional regulator, transcriptional repressor for pyruvate dehydrogenase complex
MSLSPIRRPLSVPEAAIAEIQRAFETGSLQEGDRLPAERELATRLGIGRSSVREAILALETMGVVEVRHGVGAFITCEPGRWLLEPLKWTSDSPPSLFSELLEARLTVEVRLAQLAAERATDGDVEAIQEAARLRAEARPSEYLERGIAFHLAVASAAHNQVLTFMLMAVSRLYFDVLEMLDRGTQQALVDYRARQQGGHEQILSAIAARAPAAAGRAMEEHLNQIKTEFPRVAAALVERGWGPDGQ